MGSLGYLGSATTPLPTSIRRILVAGPSGSGKTTLCRALARAFDMPTVEIDSLYHGPGWTERPTFVSDVDEFTAGPAWVIEWQYRSVKPMLAVRADLLVWLDHSRWLVTRRVILRTAHRRLRRLELWNGNTEPPMRTFLTDRDHIVRWSWRSYGKYATEIPALLADPGGEQLAVVRLSGQRQVDAWLTGPVAAAARIPRSTREVQSPFRPPET
jgi:adenylate kinase family enzyme